MAGIVKSTKRRFLVGKRIKEVEVPGTELDMSLFTQDLTSVGGSASISSVNKELQRLPVIVKNEATLAFVQGAWKIGAMYAYNGDTKSIEEFTFSRNSQGSRTHLLGKIFMMAEGSPRPSYDPISSALIGTKFEKASTNLLTDSGILEGLGSFPSKSTSRLDGVDTGFDIGPLFDKGLKLHQDASMVVFANKSYDFTTTTKCAFSFYVKMDDGSVPGPSHLAVRMGDNGESITQYTHVGGGVYRGVSVGDITPSNTLVGVRKTPTHSDKSFTVTGFQLEEGVLATSYIPTTNSAATRLADKLTSNRPIAVYPNNSFYLESDSYTGWFGDGVDHLITGRNMFAQYIAVEGMYINNISGVAASDALHSVSGFIPVMGGADYVLSSPGLNQVRFVSFDVDRNYISGVLLADEQGASVIYRPASNAAFIRFSCRSNEHPITTWKLERGTIATPWSPAPEDLVQIDANGNLKVESNGSDHLRSLSLVPRALTQEEI